MKVITPQREIYPIAKDPSLELDIGCCFGVEINETLEFKNETKIYRTDVILFICYALEIKDQKNSFAYDGAWQLDQKMYRLLVRQSDFKLEVRYTVPLFKV